MPRCYHGSDMKVIRSRLLGFCMGVRRAVDMALSESSPGGCTIYTLGPLIHNPRVLEDLEKRGVKILGEGEFPSASENATVIIRAHGVPPLVEEELARRGTRVLDATCPHVKASQKKARSFAEKGYRIFLAGEKNHGEVTGIRGYVEAAAAPKGEASAGAAPQGVCWIVGSPEEAAKAGSELSRLEPSAKTVLIGQTTISSAEYSAIAEQLRRNFPDMEILDTICGGAHADRQEALRELCGKADAVIVAGGRESANTRRLLNLALELGKPAWLVEKPEDLPPEIANYRTVGLGAGASTPDSLIDEIEEALKTK